MPTDTLTGSPGQLFPPAVEIKLANQHLAFARGQYPLEFVGLNIPANDWSDFQVIIDSQPYTYPDPDPNFEEEGESVSTVRVLNSLGTIEIVWQ